MNLMLNLSICWQHSLYATSFAREQREATERGDRRTATLTERRQWTRAAPAGEPSVHLQGARVHHGQLQASPGPRRFRVSLRWLLGGWHPGCSQAAI